MFGDTGNVMVVSAGGSPGPNESAGMTKLVDFSFVRVYERVALAVPAFAASACASWALVTPTSKTASRSARLFCSAVIKAWDKVIGRPSWAGAGGDSCANAAGGGATAAGRPGSLAIIQASWKRQGERALGRTVTWCLVQTTGSRAMGFPSGPWYHFTSWMMNQTKCR